MDSNIWYILNFLIVFLFHTFLFVLRFTHFILFIIPYDFLISAELRMITLYFSLSQIIDSIDTIKCKAQWYDVTISHTIETYFMLFI